MPPSRISTVMAVAEQKTAAHFYAELQHELDANEALRAFTLLRLTADNTGATVE